MGYHKKKDIIVVKKYNNAKIKKYNKKLTVMSSLLSYETTGHWCIALMGKTQQQLESLSQELGENEAISELSEQKNGRNNNKNFKWFENLSSWCNPGKYPPKRLDFSTL